jgi:hypothetical protein
MVMGALLALEVNDGASPSRRSSSPASLPLQPHGKAGQWIRSSSFCMLFLVYC